MSGTDTAQPTAQPTVHLAVYDGMADWETGHATAELAVSGHRVVAVGRTAEPVTTVAGLRLLPEITLDQLRPADSALLILPGAGAWLQGAELAPFAEAARAFVDAGVPVAAICGAVVGLAGAGLLDERAHTAAAPEVLAMSGYAGGAHYREADAVTDGDVITAGPTDPEAFAREILTRLDAYPPEVVDAWFRLYADSDASAYPIVAAAQGS
ncbi:DJ-1/PfpI family protein [Streptomyces triticirhizae]|uniref:Glutamine amidotransferase n=1 Tax=Streptomyces triticirhizae TaxID=2483353 RepID=A0A3M2KSV4_9ACTN|nr:DJ-1/PfpI family protein [Streptomyces triticirhizae]RMI28519.1 glutamine amidotransferase [Streptomyces triticirhizae]